MDSASLWFGGGSEEEAASSGLHFDTLDNFHVLLQGRKTWTVFDPGDAHLLNLIAPVEHVLPDGKVQAHKNDINVHFAKFVNKCKQHACVRACVQVCLWYAVMRSSWLPTSQAGAAR